MRKNKLCKYCGIEHNRSVDFCHNIECKRKARRDKQLKQGTNNELICEYCGEIVKYAFKKPLSCSKKECRHLAYKNNKYQKICNICGNKFHGTQKQNLCNECRELRKREHNFILVNKKIYCKDCKIFLYSEKVYHTKESRIGYNICEKCKNKQKEVNYKNRVKHINKVNENRRIDNIIHPKISLAPKYKQLGYATYREYMKNNNPMYDKNVSKKVSKTLKNNYKNGKIIKKLGKDHHKWSGLRSINKHIRDNLAEWRKQILKDGNYECKICKKRNCYLHVHHTTPLHIIIKNVALELNIDIKTIENGGKDFLLIKDKVIEFHFNNNIGILLCEDHHAEIDKHYHKSKRNENKKN